MGELVILSGATLPLTPERMRQAGNICLLARELLNDMEYDAASLPDLAFVAPSTSEALSRQIAEPGGLHTCDMTTTVNAFIWQGWLTGEQGTEIHDRFPRFQPDRQFAERVINGMRVLVASREEHAIRAISGERLYGGMLALQHLSETEATTKMLGALSRGVVLNVGDNDHARLAVGYDATEAETRLWVTDPYRPYSLELRPIKEVVSFHPSTVAFGVAKKTESLAYRPDIPFEVQ